MPESELREEKTRKRREWTKLEDGEKILTGVEMPGLTGEGVAQAAEGVQGHADAADEGVVRRQLVAQQGNQNESACEIRKHGVRN